MHGFILSESSSGVVITAQLNYVLVANDDGTWSPQPFMTVLGETLTEAPNPSEIPGATLTDALNYVNDYMTAGVNTSAVVNTSPIPGVTLADVLVVINDYMIAHP